MTAAFTGKNALKSSQNDLMDFFRHKNGTQ
jgi:hypothetical protein